MGLPKNDYLISYYNDDTPSENTIISDGTIEDNVQDVETPENVDDTSTEIVPETPEPVIYDGVTPEATGTSGDEGDPLGDEEAPINPEELPEPTYTQITIKQRSVIEDFRPSELQKLANAGVKFYVIYTDDTEDEVTWDEIYDPHVVTTEDLVIEADAIGAASNQHFWDDDNGAHVTDDEQDNWTDEYDKPNHGGLSAPTSDKPWHNILLNSLGVLLRTGLLNLVAISKNGIAFYDGNANTTEDITAFFGSNRVQIGRDNTKHLIMDANGITVYNGDGTIAPLNAANINAVQATINELIAGSVTTETLRAASAYIAALEAANVSASDISADKATIGSLVSGSVTTDTLRAASAYIAALEAASVSANDISADKATLNELVAGDVTTTTLRAASAYIAALSAASISASDISADHATIGSLDATYATIDNLNAATARIGSLEADHVSTSDFEAEQANIDNLQAATADIDTIRANSAKVANLTAAELEADHATIGSLDTNYAQVNLANVDNAWIENGIVKDGAITNAMINSVSANKLTAGTIDASNIIVTNLNADNITAGTINGERIGNGSLSLSKLEEDVYTETEVDGIVQNLQTQIDGAIETWTGTDVPTLQNAPAVNWNTNSIKDTHVGDVYFVVNSQSQQNGYNYRFTKSGNTYSWQLIKDNDVTNALQRLTDAEGRIGTIETFDTTVSSFMTNTDNELSSIKTAATTLEGRVDTAEGTLATKVDTTTFNTLSQTVAGNSSSIQQLTTETTTLTEKVTLGAPYTQVEWVEFTGKNICRLDYRPGLNGAFGFEADFITYNAFNSGSLAKIGATRESIESTIGFIFGVRGNNASVASNYGPAYTFYALMTYTSSGYMYDGGHRTVAKLYTDKRRQQCSLRNGIYTAPDGSTVNVGIPAYQPANACMYVSGGHFGGGTSKAAFEGISVTRIYSLKFYDNDILAVDLIPAIRKSDSMTGLYDSVSGVFYPSYGMLFGDEVGDLGDSPNLLNQLAIANPALSDLRTENTRLITVESNDIKKLQDGQRLTVQLKYTTVSETYEAAGITNTIENPAASNAVMLAVRDSNGTLIGGYENPVYYNSTTLLTTHYAVGMILQLQFRMNVVIGTTLVARGWFCDSDYNTNTNDTARYVQWYNNIFAKKALRNSSIIVGDEDGYEEIDEEVTFDLAYPILWRTAALAINKTDYAYSWTMYVDRTLATCYPDVSGVKNQMLYLVGKPNGGKFTIKAPMLTFDTPTEPDGLYYIPIGKLGNQSNGQNYLFFSTAPNPTMFAFVGDAFQQVQGIVVKTTAKLNETIDTVDEHTRRIGSLETTVVTKADGSEVTTISNNLSTLQQDVNTYKTTVSSTYATKTALSNAQTSLQAAIDDKAASSDLTALSSRVSTAESTIEQHSNSIALKANSSDVYTKQQSDGLISTEVTNRNAAISAATDAINLSVSQTYTTKTEFNNLEIGGRNLLPSSIISSKNIEGSTKEFQLSPAQLLSNFGSGVGKYIWGEFEEDTQYTFTAIAFQNNPSSGTVGRQGPIFYFRYSDNTYTTMPFEYNGTGDPIQKSMTSTYGKTVVLLDASYGKSDCTWTYRNLKLEKGNRPTDWTPAPEDHTEYTDSQVEAAKAAIKVTTDGISTEVSKKANSATIISTINQSAESIKIQASRVEIDGTAIFTAISSDVDDAITDKGYATTTQAQGYASTAKSEAISAAATDATSKANAAEANAKAAIPSDISELNNDTGFITNADVPTKVSELTNDSGFQTASQVNTTITGKGYQTSSQVESAITSKGYATTTQAQGYASTAKSEAISAAATDATSKANAAESRIISRGEQLVINGNGFMGDNTNFTDFTFDGSMSNNSPGSFTRAVGYNTVFTNEMFPVDASKEYIAEFDVMAGSLGAKMYAMLMFYDVDKRVINVQMVSYFPGSTTTLARELKNGDTVVYLTDASGWTDTSTAHQRSLIIWDYTNSFGYTYPAETYSRNFYYNSSGMWNQGSLNKSSNTITLRTAWTGGTHVAGTPISQNSSGSIYSYFWYITNQTIFPTEWTHISGTYKGMASRNPTPNSGTFWPGTAYCKIGWLWNHGHTSSAPQSQIWITNVSVKEYVASSSDAVKRTQRIYWRTSSPKSSWTMPPAWLQTAVSATDVFDQWTRKVPRLTANVDGTGTKYLYLYTCEQREMVDGTLAYTTVLLDDSTTVIDGGSIITNSITANQIAAGSITANEIDASDLHVSAANIDGTLTASQINANGLTIGYSQVTDTPTIPSKVSDLTNDSGFQTATQVNTTITSKGYQTSSQVESAITSKGYATTTQAQGYADAKDSAIAAAAKRTYVSIAVTAINYAAGTATLQATLFVDGTATTSGVTYIWLKDGTAISGQTARTLSVTAAMGLEHVYSCTVTYA